MTARLTSSEHSEDADAQSASDKAGGTRPPMGSFPRNSEEACSRSAEPGGALRTLMRNDRVKKCAISVLVVAALVALWGGYIQGWQWTGFRANEQLWDWLHLLLLPVVVGTIPLWIQHADYISRARRVTYVAVIAAFAGFVVPAT